MTNTTKLPLGREQINTRCIIPGSLGVWEDYFVQLTDAWGCMPDTIQPTHLIFSADNGIVKEGHISFSADITRLHTKNMLQNGTAVTRFATFNNIPYHIVDVGINSNDPVGINCKSQGGTDSFLSGPAMSEHAFNHVFRSVTQLVRNLIHDEIHPANLISFGEMGIGNTTTSAAVLSALTGESPIATVGAGSGANAATLQKKRHIVEEGLRLHKDFLTTPTSILQHVGGFDLVALTAAMLTCTNEKIPFVIDGFITSVALACAKATNSEVIKYAIPSHISREIGMPIALQYTGIDIEKVPLRAGMALGEGTGAIMMVRLLQTAYDAFIHMSSFNDMMKIEN